MDRLRLTEQEIGFYFDIFDACDVEKIGKIPMKTCLSLLNQAGLSQVTTRRVLNILGAVHGGFLGRNQFFTMLRLVALAQAGQELTTDAVHISGRNIQLPKFSPDAEKKTIFSWKSPVNAAANISPDTDISEGEFRGSNEDFRGTLSEISTHLSTVSPPRTPTVTRDEELSDNASGFTIDQTETDKWLQYGDDEESLLTKEHVERTDPYGVLQTGIMQSNDPFSPHRSHSHKRREHYVNRSSSSVSSGSVSTSTLNSNTSISDGTVWHAFDDGTVIKHVTPEWAYRNLEHRPKNRAISPIVTSPVHTPPSSDIDNTDYEVRLKRSSRSKSSGVGPYGTKSHTNYIMNGTQRVPTESKKEHHQRWLSLFTLHPKREVEYANQFENLFPDGKTNNTQRASFSDIQQLFMTQFRVSPEDLKQIWRLADLDRDNYLNKAEFCLASHLAHLHGNKGLSINDAVSATASYIAKHLSGVPNSSSHTARSLISNAISHRSFAHKPAIEMVESQQHRSIATDFQPVETGDAEDDYSVAEQDAFGETALLPDRVPGDTNLLEHFSPRSSHSSSSATSISVNSSDSQISSQSSSVSTSSSSEVDSDPENHKDSPSRLVDSKSNFRKVKHRRVDPLQVLAAVSGHRPSKLAQYSGGHRRRLLASLIREAKAANHSLLRLNNEIRAEWIELNDQHVNLSAQLQHLGLEPPS
ncbi:RalBP1-associated Eps domain-containing protein 1, variant 2 [Clonorchis sinensis]|uniref:RalBP1-associated Eps domain-containing protein 1, variant 2 n=1 Tax=Clonorchis sinensis TaxID=79923 RepID=A0A8T1M3P7_CLOSI|nr:RalBP1-associated Eps domain-containing protein 1, variant 2 [Clonorchis sinensis]